MIYKKSKSESKALVLSKKVAFTFVNYIKQLNIPLLIMTIIIAFLSLLFLSTIPSVSIVSSYFFKQSLYFALGFLLSFIFTLVDYRILLKFYVLIGLFALALIFYTLIFGFSVTGSGGVDAKAWIRLPFNLTFQPIELVRICFIITISRHIHKLSESGKLNKPLHTLLLGVHMGIPMILAHFEGDDGAALIMFFTFIAMALVGGVKWHYFIILAVILAIFIPILWNYILRDYQKNRILSIFSDNKDILGIDLQQYQAKLSIGSASLFGKGLYTAPRVLSKVVPVQESDFIFSAIAEEVGFFGSMIFLLILALFAFSILYSAYKANNIASRMICVGVFVLIVSQMVLNLMMCLGIFPVIGITLPFFSAGGSSVLSLMIGLGIVQNTYRTKDEQKTLLAYKYKRRMM